MKCFVSFDSRDALKRLVNPSIVAEEDGFRFPLCSFQFQSPLHPKDEIVWTL